MFTNKLYSFGQCNNGNLEVSVLLVVAALAVLAAAAAVAAVTAVSFQNILSLVVREVLQLLSFLQPLIGHKCSLHVDPSYKQGVCILQ